MDWSHCTFRFVWLWARQTIAFCIHCFLCVNLYCTSCQVKNQLTLHRWSSKWWSHHHSFTHWSESDSDPSFRFLGGTQLFQYLFFHNYQYINTFTSNQHICKYRNPHTCVKDLGWGSLTLEVSQCTRLFLNLLHWRFTRFYIACRLLKNILKSHFTEISYVELELDS